MEASWHFYVSFFFKNENYPAVQSTCLAMQWTLIISISRWSVQSVGVTARVLERNQDWVNQTRVLRYAKEKTSPSSLPSGKIIST